MITVYVLLTIISIQLSVVISTIWVIRDRFDSFREEWRNRT